MADPEETHFIGRVAQKAVIERNGAVLMVRNEGETRWAFPGGRLNEGEAPLEGLVREVREEIGCDIEVVRPLSTDTWISPKGEPHFLVTYLARLPEGSELRLEAGEIEEARWVTREDMGDETIYPAYRRVLAIHFESVY